MSDERRHVNIISSEFRAPAWPGHVEFAPVYEEPEPGPGWKRIDGAKRLDYNGMFVFSKLYRARIGSYPNGDAMYFVGEYVGNHRHILDNDPSPQRVGSTWQIFLQEDPDDKDSIECYRLCDLEVLSAEGVVVVEANDYEAKRPDLMVYYTEKAPAKPELGLKVTHPVHGGGEVVRVTGTGNTWYANVEYAWPDSLSTWVEGPDFLARARYVPEEGTLVRRLVAPTGGDGHWVYGEVAETEEIVPGDGHVTVRFENEDDDAASTTFTVEEFYGQFMMLGDSVSSNFHEVFGLERGPRMKTPKVRRLKRDVRTHNQRIMQGSSRSSMALSALSARNTPDSGEFVRVPNDSGNWNPDATATFRWHRERPLPPKNEDFAPLVGRPEKKGAPKRRPGDAKLMEARAKMALDGEGSGEEQLCRAYEAEPCTDGPLRPYLPCEAPLFEAIEANGSVVSF